MKKWWKRRVAPAQASGEGENNLDIYKTSVLPGYDTLARSLQRLTCRIRLQNKVSISSDVVVKSTTCLLSKHSQRAPNKVQALWPNLTLSVGILWLVVMLMNTECECCFAVVWLLAATKGRCRRTALATVHDILSIESSDPCCLLSQLKCV